jgi:hypothetical protein
LKSRFEELGIPANIRWGDLEKRMKGTDGEPGDEVFLSTEPLEQIT